MSVDWQRDGLVVYETVTVSGLSGNDIRFIADPDDDTLTIDPESDSRVELSPRKALEIAALLVAWASNRIDAGRVDE